MEKNIAIKVENLTKKFRIPEHGSPNTIQERFVNPFSKAVENSSLLNK